MDNIIFIVIESLRPKNLSLFDYKKETDKNLKELSKESSVFKKYFSVSNATMPSVTCLFNGKYPNNIGMVHQIPNLTSEDLKKLKQNKFWLPIYLRDKGYDTISLDVLGFWLKRGFNYHYGKNISEINKVNKFKTFLKTSLIKKILMRIPSRVYSLLKKIIKFRSSYDYPPTRKIVDLAISKIKESKKPFFLFMRFEETHFPFSLVKKTKSSEKNEVNDILKRIKNHSQREYVKKRITDIKLYSMRDIIERYDFGLMNIDKEIGRFVEFLKKENLWDNSIFVVVGDHGENFENNGIFLSRAGVYDDSMNTLLMMKFPGLEKGKTKEINELVQNVDVAPTILDYIGDKKGLKKAKFDGKSMIPLIKKGKPIRNKVFLFDCFSDTKAVRTKNRKSIVSKDPKCYLCKAEHHKRREEYDLKKDPGEKINMHKRKSKNE